MRLKRKEKIDQKANNSVKMKSVRLSILTLIFFLIVVACNEPIKKHSFQHFTPLYGWQNGEEAVFELDIRDSITPHTLYICAQIDNNYSFNKEKIIPIKVLFISPDSLLYNDTLDLPLNVIEDKKYQRQHGRILQLEWPYLKGAKVNRTGVWKIKISHRDKENSVYKNILGLGVRYE